MLLCGALGAGSPAPAQAGEGEIELAQLFGGSKKRSQEAAEVNLRVDNVEQQIRNMTGKLEELSFQLQQLQDQLRRMQEDNEFRFQELEGGKPPSNRGSLQPPAGAGAPVTTGQVDQGGGQTHVLGTMPQGAAPSPPQDSGPALSGPIDLSALARGEASSGSGDDMLGPADPSGGADLQGEPNRDYEEAYNRILQGDYAGAEQMLTGFLSAYPDHELAGNAQYWLGESLFARGRYREAADAFLKSYSEYPNSSKGPDSLLKLGLSLAGLGEQAAACATYGELLTKFPNAPGSVKKRAAVESKVIGCAS